MARRKGFFGIFGDDAGKQDNASAASGSQGQMPVQVRRYHRRDHQVVLELSAENFSGVCLDENIENAFGQVGAEWQQHKMDSIDYDLTNSPTSCFVAEVDGKVVGVVCNRLYHDRSVGHVANLAVQREYQGRGIGKALMKATIDHFRETGMRFARIETLEQNEKGQKFYPSLGFKEIGRQIFYFMKL